jgi:hypothetical protein
MGRSIKKMYNLLIIDSLPSMAAEERTKRKKQREERAVHGFWRGDNGDNHSPVAPESGEEALENRMGLWGC